MSWLTRIQNSFRQDRLADELSEETQFHIEQRTAEYIASGMPPEEARRRAAERFGPAMRAREATQDVRLLPRLESVVADVRYGLRQMGRNKLLTGSAILSLGLALGAVTAAFAIIDAVMLRPLPVHQPEQLVYLATPGPPDQPGAIGDSFNYPLFKVLRETARGKADLFLASFQGRRDVKFDDADDIEKRAVQFLSGDAFSILGIRPHIGRLLTPEDDKAPGERPVAVLSYDFWRTRFGADPKMLGKRVRFNESEFEIVGIADKAFPGLEPGVRTDLWVPASMQRRRSLESFNNYWFRTWARLRNDTTPQQLADMLTGPMQRLRKENFRPPANMPKNFGERYLNESLMVLPAGSGPSELRRGFQKALLVLAGTVVLVLLIATVNVANLLLARAAAREREMALRLSIGAGRARLMQQMLVESGLFALCALAAGAILGVIAAPLLVEMLGRQDRPLVVDLRVDWRLISFLVAVSAFITGLVGLVPALRASGTKPADGLKASSNKASANPVVFRAFLTAQVAFCFLALFGAALFVGSMQNLRKVDLGFNAQDVTLFEVSAPPLGRQQDKGTAVWRDVHARVRSMPEVRFATASGFGLFSNNSWNELIRVPGHEQDGKPAMFFSIGPGFGETMQFRLVDGRLFSDREAFTEPIPKVAVVNEAFARKYFNGSSPVGRQFEKVGGRDRAPETLQIVGLVRDARYTSVRRAVEPTVYVPVGGGDWQTVAVRGVHSESGIRAIRQQIRSTHAALIVTNVVSQERLVEDSLVQERVLSVLSTFFAVLAVVLAGIGLYGVLNYTTLQRTREIGIRVALGAQRSAVVRLVVQEALILTVVGAVVGVGAGLGLAKYVSSLLYGVTPFDPQAIGTPTVILLAAAAIAATVPAVRAVRIQPSTALRYE